MNTLFPTIMTEWKPLNIAEFARDFEINASGHIRRKAGKDCAGRTRKERVLTQFVLPNGYVFSILSANKVRRTVLIHRALMLTFGPPIPFEDAEVNHLDGDKENNSLSNLEWVTPSQNHFHASDIGLKKRGAAFWSSKLTTEDVIDIKRRLAINDTLAAIARDKRCSAETIARIRDGKSWRHITL